jgi:hypothetical protein
VWEAFAADAIKGGTGGTSSATGEQRGGVTDFGSTFTVNTGGSSGATSQGALIAIALAGVVLAAIAWRRS